ncbi:nuclear pore complex protein Nup153 isoform X2 [Aplysia californica]|uniref:Nuclear pore complex protein Nup153 n=1 Tax=Aplysia californica TaxID=6500 RepID=A0ABM0JEP7_APLCA|nr:nuclear pore complex protein Nup153 isoform X2 [Aplysia californica]
MMASEGGGKIRPKRNQGGSKPYDRKSSLFGKIKSSVKDLLIPSWLSRGSGDSDTDVNGQESGRQVSPTGYAGGLNELTDFSGILDGRLNSGISNENQEAIEPAMNSGLVRPSNGQDKTQSASSSSHPSGCVTAKESTHLRMSDSYSTEDNKEVEATPIKPIMVSTGSFTKSSAVPVSKKQRLWSPEIARQGKPFVPPSTEKPAFNSLLFGSLINKNDASLFGDSFGESSFYAGKTRYGGASTERKQSLNKSLPYQTSLPLRKQVKANKLNNSYQATTSATAQRILETLDRMSTPLGDAKKIPTAEAANDSILSFTPTSYRRTSILGMSSSATRPLQFPSRGPPTSQYQAASQAVIAKNRYRPSERDHQHVSSGSIEKETSVENLHPGFSVSVTQESTVVHENKEDASGKESEASSVGTGTGKIKTKKFSQHMSSKKEENDDAQEVPNLRTDFTLPVASMDPISFQSFPVKSHTVAQTSIPLSSLQSDVSPLKFTFSTPIQEKRQPANYHTLNFEDKDFVFSSPIKASAAKTSAAMNSAAKTSAAGAEEGAKTSPEPAVGASSVAGIGVSSAAFSPAPVPSWGSTAPKPKTLSPDIGGTSSSFKSYSKWGSSKSNSDISAASENPGFSLAPASSLKSGSVMDILGDGKSLSSPVAPAFLKTDDLMAKFKKPPGAWDCGTCMLGNTAGAQKCVACETPKPRARKTDSTTVLKAPTASATSTPPATDDFLAKFKKPAGSWECDTCMLTNKPDAVKCVACEAPKPGAKSSQAGEAGNKPSLGALFKKPSGSWECDTCMVQNSTGALRCVACDSPKPGLQSAGVVPKSSINGTDAPAVKLNPGGGFSISLPAATTATTVGSGGFKFGNTAVTTASLSHPSSSGFVFGQTSAPSKTPISSSENVSGGFKIGLSTSSASEVGGISGSSLSQAKTGGFVFGAATSGSSASLTDSKVSQGFQFGTSGGDVSSTPLSGRSISTPETSSQTSTATLRNGDESTSVKESNSAASTVQVGFQFGSSFSSRVDKSQSQKLEDSSKGGSGSCPEQQQKLGFGFSSLTSSSSLAPSSNPPSNSFSPQSPSMNINPADPPTAKPAPGLFSFGATTPGASAANTNTGLGMGRSFSDLSNSTPIVNGRFGSGLDVQSPKDKTTQGGLKPSEGFDVGAPAAVFGGFGQPAVTAPSSTTSLSQTLSSYKRSVDFSDSDASSAKCLFGVGSANNEAATNGLFSYGTSSATAFGSVTTPSGRSSSGGFSGFGVSTAATNLTGLSSPGGGFQMGAATGFGQSPASSVTPAVSVPTFGFSDKAPDASSGPAGGFSFRMEAPNFNFGSNQTSSGSSTFQFGGKPTEVLGSAQTNTQGLFQFSGGPAPAVLPAVTDGQAFGGAPAGVGSFSIGFNSSSENSGRKVKKALRRIKK